MYKTPVICSLLMAFGLSSFIVGCETSKEPSKSTSSTGQMAPGKTEKTSEMNSAGSSKATKSETDTKKTSEKKAPDMKEPEKKSPKMKTPSVGSTTGGGAEVPGSPSEGSEETPKKGE